MLGVKFAHHIGVGLNALRKFLLTRAVEIAQRCDVGAFPGGLRLRRLRLLHLGPPLGVGALTWPAPYLMEVAHGHAPVRHGAAWVGLCNFLELPLRLFIPEVMQQSDSAIERRLYVGCAGDRKGHRTQPLGSGSFGKLGRMAHGHLGNGRQRSEGKQG